MTPNIIRIDRLIRARWPDVASFGVTNCRKISGSSTWSQHAFSNAWDITSPHTPRTQSNPTHMAYLDRIAAYLEEHRTELGIRNILWRQRNHWDHIHVDCWPRGYGNPPCNGGTLRVQYPDGHLETTFRLYPAGEGIMLQRGDKGAPVERAQELIIEFWRRRGITALPRFGADADFGAETEDWTNQTLEELGHPETGIFDAYLHSEIIAERDNEQTPHNHDDRYSLDEHTHPVPTHNHPVPAHTHTVTGRAS